VKRIAKWLALSVLIFVVLIGILIARRHQFEERAREKREAEREAQYESSRRRYAEILRPGMTRKEVQDYFHKNNIVSVNRSWDDFVKIGREDPPWYCAERNVYIAFQFESRGERSSIQHPSDSDVLTAVSVTRSLDRCL
jgi:hypothetical protein